MFRVPCYPIPSQKSPGEEVITQHSTVYHDQWISHHSYVQSDNKQFHIISYTISYRTKAIDLAELCNQICMFITQKHKHFTMAAE